MGFHSEQNGPQYSANIGSIQSILGTQKVELISVGPDFRIYINDGNEHFDPKNIFHHDGKNFIQFQIEQGIIKITGIFVDAQFRGNNIADILFYSLIQIAQKMNIRRFYASSTPKPSFCKKLVEWGFTAVNQDTFCEVVGYESGEDGLPIPQINLYTKRNSGGFKSHSKGKRHIFYTVKKLIKSLPPTGIEAIPFQDTFILQDAAMIPISLEDMLSSVTGKLRIRTHKAVDHILKRSK